MGGRTDGNDQATGGRGAPETLPLILAAPTIWAGHFLACYVTAAIWCEGIAGRGGDLDAARVAVGGYTAAAIGLLLLVARAGWRRRSSGRAPPADAAVRFAGSSTLVLAALATAATVMVAAPALLLATCR